MFDSITAKAQVKGLKGCDLARQFDDEKDAAKIASNLDSIRIMTIGDALPGQLIEFKKHQEGTTRTDSVVVDNHLVFSVAWDTKSNSQNGQSCSNFEKGK